MPSWIVLRKKPSNPERYGLPLLSSSQILRKMAPLSAPNNHQMHRSFGPKIAKSGGQQWSVFHLERIDAYPLPWMSWLGSCYKLPPNGREWRHRSFHYGVITLQTSPSLQVWEGNPKDHKADGSGPLRGNLGNFTRLLPSIGFMCDWKYRRFLLINVNINDLCSGALNITCW